MGKDTFKTMALAGAFLLIVVALIYVLFGNTNNRPITQIAVLRECDFVTLGGTTNAVCEDTTQWSVFEMSPTLLPTPVPEPISMGEGVIDSIGVSAVLASPVRVESEVAATEVVVVEVTEPAAMPVPGTEEPVVAAPALAPVAFGTPTQIRYSHYWPPLGGTNCSNFSNGVCISKMASGEAWAPYVGRAVACPPEWPFGTVVELNGFQWVCKDRGGAIKYVNGIPWVDFLEATAVYAFGSIITVNVAFP